MGATVSLTPARRRGLAAIVIADSRMRPSRRSNITLIGHGFVYWQTADWLVEHGYLEPVVADGPLDLTDAGRALAANDGRVQAIIAGVLRPGFRR